VFDVLKKNVGFVGKTSFSGLTVHGPFELQQQNYMEALASVALTVTLHL